MARLLRIAPAGGAPAGGPATNTATAHAGVATLPRLADFRATDTASLISASVVRGCVRAADFLVTTLLGLAIAALYVNEPSVVLNPSYVLSLALTGLLTVAMFEVLKLYSTGAFSSVLSQMPRILLGWTAAVGLLVSALFFLKIGPELSRVWLALWFVSGTAALIAGRLVLSRLVRRWAREGRLFRRAAIYGSGPVAETLIADLEADTESDVRICGIFDDRADDRVAYAIAGYPRLGGIADLLGFCRRSRLDLVMVAVPVAAEQRLNSIVRRLAELPVEIKLPASATSLRFSPRTYSRVGSVAMIDVHDKPIADWGHVAKWVFDKTIAAAALVLLAPVMAVVAIAIKLESKGPVLFRQKRYGFNNELIEVFKFRSMYTDKCDAAAVRLVTKDDPRVTRIGRFIRKTSIDELPQLFNVLIGNLSLVGPRPHALQAKADNRLYDEVVEGYFARHKVKPGITGWAQINGWRGETDTEEKIRKRVEHDLYYIENWSVLLDLYILVKTPGSLLKTENAY